MNSDLPGIKGNSDLFDPSVKSSICFTPMGRKATEEFLAKCEGTFLFVNYYIVLTT
jgi:hypothetical protein